ncbi:hepatitis A virus cellular receptor 1-like [Pecten maximus]|uniref:hepatitis A virus cellular receptor 1-like n=1 Tax=Pecten maximus TaxID=6579 RepID=UPI001457EFC4|nr:hepatitis A virus cellular receptor 1-like [Pecten maximus]
MGRVQVVGWLLVLLGNVVRGDVVCMQCDQAVDIDTCLSSGTIKCGPQERCFLEKVTTKNLKSVYNAGCRSAVVCNIMTTLGGGNGRRDLSRPSRELVNCAQCCNTVPGVASKGPCNSELCGASPTVDNSIRCLDCDHLVSGAAACVGRDVCTDTQVCATSIHVLGGTQIKYNYRCEEKHLCEGMIKNGLQSRASDATGVKICDACCKDTECNKRDCFELRKLMPALFSNGTATTTKPTTPAPTAKPTTTPTTPAPTTTPTTPAPTTTPTTPAPTTTPTTQAPTTTPTTQAPTTNPSTPAPTTTPTTPAPTTTPTTQAPTTTPTTPAPTTTPTTQAPTTTPTTQAPTTTPTTPAPTTTPTTPAPTTTPTTQAPTTTPTTPAPTTTPTTQAPTTTPTTPAPTTTPTTPAPTTPLTSKLTPPSTKSPGSSSAPSGGSSRRPSTFAPNFTVI